MAGRVEVVSREEYDAWMEDQKAIVMSNGTEEQS
jgi:heme/copper-type cytochrome/quinol oxidase subunit 2